MSDRKQISKALTIQLIKTHGIMCQNCKKEEFEHIHHIDKNPSNNSFSNLMLVCSKCHTKEHDRDRICTRLIRIRFETYHRLTRNSTKIETELDDFINICMDSYEREIQPSYSRNSSKVRALKRRTFTNVLNSLLPLDGKKHFVGEKHFVDRLVRTGVFTTQSECYRFIQDSIHDDTITYDIKKEIKSWPAQYRVNWVLRRNKVKRND